MGGLAENSSPDVTVVADLPSLVATAARELVAAIEAAIRARGVCRLALSGGSTPKGVYEQLARPPLAGRIAWDRVQLFWSDERFVPSTDERSNYRMAREAMLATVPVPPANVHRVATEGGTATDVAERYESDIRMAFGEPAGMPRFDVIMLGLGADGHTASLFPGTAALSARDRLVVANDAAALGLRITMTYPLINAARLVLFLVAGREKAAALRQVLHPEAGHTLPAQGVRPERGRLVWVADEAAAAFLAAGLRREI